MCFIFKSKKKKVYNSNFVYFLTILLHKHCSSVESTKSTCLPFVMWCEGTVIYYQCDTRIIFTLQFLQITQSDWQSLVCKIWQRKFPDIQRWLNKGLNLHHDILRSCLSHYRHWIWEERKKKISQPWWNTIPEFLTQPSISLNINKIQVGTYQINEALLDSVQCRA